MDLKPQNFRITIEKVSFGCGSPLDEISLEGVKCLRHLAGRRTVWQVLHEGSTMLLKLFYKHPKQLRDVGREWDNASRLYDEGVQIPKPLFTGRSSDGVSVVAFEFIDNGRVLGEALAGADVSVQQNSLSQLLAMHAQLHSLGCYQSDNHLGNYLWNDNDLYMLDAASCVFKSASLSIGERIKNMAMLEANIPLPLGGLYSEAFPQYLKHCQGKVDPAVFSSRYTGAFTKAVRKRLEDYRRKTKRSSSELERVKLPGKTWHACRNMDAGLKQKLLDDPDQFFMADELLKDGNTCSVSDFKHDDREYVIKRYNRKSLVYRLLHMLMPVRALTSWTGGHVLRLFGVATPKPVACLICKSGLLTSRAYLVMEKVFGRELNSIEKPALLDVQIGLPEKFAQIWLELDTLRVTHGDMKASNLILGSDNQLILIDLDGIGFHRLRWTYNKSKKKDLLRFLRNWADDPEIQAAFKKTLSEFS